MLFRSEALGAEVDGHKATVASLRQATHAADSANRTKIAFLSGMSHELRTPLHAISGAVQAIQETPLDTEQQRYANIAAGASTTMQSLIDEVLDIARFEGGDASVSSPESFDLHRLLEGLLFYKMILLLQRLKVKLIQNQLQLIS